MAIVDGANGKKLLFFDSTNGKQLGYTLEHSLDILEIGDFDFDSVDELYLDEDSSLEKWYEI